MSIDELYVFKIIPEDKKDIPTFCVYLYTDGKPVSGQVTANDAETLGARLGTNYHTISNIRGTKGWNYTVPKEASENVQELSLTERVDFKKGLDASYLGERRTHPLSRRAAMLKLQTA